MVTRKITDNMVDASSERSSSEAARYGRLGSSRCWVAGTSSGAFFSVGLGDVAAVDLIAVQGNPNADEWITSVSFSYADVYGNWTVYKPFGATRTFDASSNRNGVNFIELNPPITARFVRIDVEGFYSAAALRFELFSFGQGISIESIHFP